VAKLRLRHPAVKGALTHTTVIGIVTAAIGGLRLALPNVADDVLAIGGLVLLVLGFAGLYFTYNGQPPSNGGNDRADNGGK